MKIIRAFTILTIFVLLSIVHLAICTSSMNTGYEIGALKRKLESIRPENRYLNYLVAKEDALPRIEQAAKGKLNMIYPEKIDYIIISSGEGTGPN